MLGFRGGLGLRAKGFGFRDFSAMVCRGPAWQLRRRVGAMQLLGA